jgi:hypothetical protein
MTGTQEILIPNEAPSAGPELRSSAAGRLTLLIAGSQRSVRVRLCFPWSDPRRHFSLRDDDDKELALIEDPADLDPESRLALDQALAEAGFVFEVTRVVDIDEEIEIRHWRVETRQGTRSFQTHLDDWPRELPGGGRLVRDVAGDLYHLADPKAMDKESRELLWAFVD